MKKINFDIITIEHHAERAVDPVNAFKLWEIAFLYAYEHKQYYNAYHAYRKMNKVKERNSHIEGFSKIVERHSTKMTELLKYRPFYANWVNVKGDRKCLRFA